MRLTVVNLFIALLLAALVTDAVPALGGPHQWLKDRLRPGLRRAGLWQKEWALFAPDVPVYNCRMSLGLETTNSLVAFWESPRFENLSVLERCRQFREGQFFYNIYNDRYSAAWAPVADYLARTEHERLLPGRRIKRVYLRRHWQWIPPPASGLAPPEEESWQIYTKELVVP